MDTWNVDGTSLSQHEETIIRDIVDDISEDGDNYDFDLDMKISSRDLLHNIFHLTDNLDITLIVTSMNTCLSCQRS